MLKLLVFGTIAVAGLSVLFHLLMPVVFEAIENIQTSEASKGKEVSAKAVDRLKFVVVGCDVAFHYKDNVMKESAPSISGASVPFYTLTYYLKDSTLEMVYSVDAKVWLKRSAPENIKRSDLFVGNSVIVNNKCMTVTAYSDDDTQQAVEDAMQSTFAMIKPDAMGRVGSVLTVMAQQQQLNIAGMRLLRLTSAQARNLYAEHQHRTFFEPLVAYISSGPVLALRLVGPGAVGRWREALGPTDSVEARSHSPSSIRALFGTDKEKNAAHGSDSVASAHRELSLLFPGWSLSGNLPSLSSAAELLDASSCLVMPHVIRAGELGSVLTTLQDDHKSKPVRVEAVRLNFLDAARYATGQLVPQDQSETLQETINELVSGTAVFLKFKSANAEETTSDFVQRFKDVIGPRDPARARKTSVTSIRATFGENLSRSALLCPFYDWKKE